MSGQTVYVAYVNWDPYKGQADTFLEVHGNYSDALRSVWKAVRTVCEDCPCIEVEEGDLSEEAKDRIADEIGEFVGGKNWFIEEMTIL